MSSPRPAKFIPILRSGEADKAAPVFLQSRYRVDFTEDDEFNSETEQLARESHNDPEIKKPLLGRNPFVTATGIDRSDSAGAPRNIEEAASEETEATDSEHGEHDSIFARWL